jgi:S-formylglutathione hydrolase FrmB
MRKIFLGLSLLVLICSVSASTVDTIAIPSDAMHKSIKAVIIKPDSYTQDGKRFPVVYLLHGFGGAFRNWVSKVPHIKQLADEYQIIVVCPDGAIGSWYFDSPVDSSYKYETFIGTEVPRYIDANFKTIADRKARAITGFSMGGHGGIFLAFRHSELYSACGSMSGALHVTVITKGYQVEKRLGDTAINRKYWNDWSALNVVENKPKDSLGIIIDCGTEDRVMPMNRAMHDKLLKLKISHEYTERPGNHDWRYWNIAIDYQLLYFSKHFKQLLSQP